MYDELIKRLRETPSIPVDTKMHNEAADAIEKLWELFQSAEKDNAKLTAWYVEKCNKHKWISVTERLPKNPQDVLVTLKSFLRPNAVYINFATYENGDWYEPDGSNPFRIANDRVTHWMPLPQPPESDGE